MKINKKLRIIDFQIISIFLLVISFFCTDHTLIRSCNIAGIIILAIWKCLSVFLSDSCVQKMKNYYKKNKKNLFHIYIGINALLIVFMTISSCCAGVYVVLFIPGSEWKLWLRLILYVAGLLAVSVIAAYQICYIITRVNKKVTKLDSNLQLTIPLTGGILVLYLFNSIILPQFIYYFYVDWFGKSVAGYARDVQESFAIFLSALIIGVYFLGLIKRIFNKSIHTHILYGAITLYILITWGISLYKLIDLMEYFGLTFLRILALWGLIGGLFLYILYLLTFYKKELFRPRMILCSAVCLYLFLAFAFPDYWIARENLKNIEERALEFTEEEVFYASYSPDYHYLISLSADAAPALISYMKENGYDISLENLDENYQSMVEEYHYGRDWDNFGYDYMYQLHKRSQEGGIRNFNASLFLTMKSMHE